MSGRVMAILRALIVFLPMSLGVGDIDAADRGFTTLDVNGEQVRIYRDDFGVPHIFAETNRGLFVAYGYTVAQDRLWQLEINRRAARGRLAEIFGRAVITRLAGLGVTGLTAIDADINARTLGYTSDELDLHFAALTDEEKEIFRSYADGISRYITEVVAPAPLDKLPFEFHALKLGVPEPWTAQDVVVFAVFEARLFLDRGGAERANQTLLANLVAKHGASAGLGIFNDVRWLDDPDAPATVPVEGAIGRRQIAAPPPHPDQMLGADEAAAASYEDDAKAVWHSLGIPTKLGSHGWVVSAAKSAEGFAMLFGGPQLGFNTPELMHEVQLQGGNGFHATGMAFAGIPVVLIGRNDHVAWTETTAAADNVDTYVETLCAGGYLFNGTCLPFETRTETIAVRDESPQTITVQRTMHGPVVAPGPGVVFSRKAAQWTREIESIRTFLAFNRAHGLQEFEAALRQMVGAGNILYADKVGNIAYWLAGQSPVRPAGYDTRLPLPGTGAAEWDADLMPMPTSLNPARGWLANWNNKPAVDYPNLEGDSGRYNRVLEIEAWLAPPGLISRDGMLGIVLDIARDTAGGGGRPARFLKPYLLAALDAVTPAHPLAPQARAVLEAWDGSDFADAVTSTNLEPGQVIFSAWQTRMLQNTFGDELGTSNVAQATVNTLLHVLDDALGGGSGVPPSRDYFDGCDLTVFSACDPYVIMSKTFDQALATLGSASDWSSRPRGVVRFRHHLSGITGIPNVGTVNIPDIGTIPESNRGTYAQIVVLSNPAISSENILTQGQSGFIRLGPSNTPEFDSHFKDQLELYRQFQYKPMPLFRNTQLEE